MRDDIAVLPLFELPSGVIINLNEVCFIAKKDITGQTYVAIMKAPASPNLSTEDVAAMVNAGLIVRLATPEPERKVIA